MSTKQKAIDTFLEGERTRTRALSKLAEEIELNGESFTRQALAERLARYMPGQPVESGRGYAFGGVQLTKAEAQYVTHFRAFNELPEDGPEVEAVTGAMVRHLTCLCGCGENTTTPRAKFLPGHDARLKSILIEVAREIRPESDIPAIAVPFVDLFRATMFASGTHDLTPVEDEEEGDEG